MRILKYALLGLGVVIVVAAAVIAYLAATFDPNQYKPQIVQAVKERTQRTLTLAGDIDVTFFPSIGARLGKATLSEKGSAREFASVTDIHVAVKLWPLLSREVVVDALEVKGLRAQLVRHKDGRTNFADLGGAPPPGKPAPKPAERTPVKIDIARVEIADAAVSYVDQQAGTKYEFDRLNLKTGRIAEGVPSDIELKVHGRGSEPAFDLETELKTRLTFDLASNAYALQGLDFVARGSAAGYKGLAVNAKGDLESRPATQELIASRFIVAVRGKQEGEDLNAKLEVPQLNVTRDKVSGNRILIDASRTGGKRRMTARLEVPAIEGTAKAFSARELTAHLDMQEEGASTRVKLASPLTGSAERRHYELPKLVANVHVANPKFPKSPIEAVVNGALAVDAAKETATLTFATKFDESTINGRAGLAKFAPPAYSFDVNIDRLDLDHYFPRTAEKKPAAGGQGKGDAAEQPIDLGAFRNLTANGTLKIGALKLSGVKSSNVRLDVRAANGRVDVNPIAANLYQGTLAGALTIQAAATPGFAAKQTLTGVQVGPLLKDFADNDMLEGKGNVALDVTAHGNTAAALRKALNGNASVRLTDGALKGINIAGSIRSARAKLGALRGEHVQPVNRTEKTDFTELSGTFAIKNGVAHNNDLAMKSPLLRVGGEGSINLANDTIDYLIKASIVGTSKGQGGRELADLQGITVPVRVSGPLDEPFYKLDFAAIATDAARQRIESTVREQVEKRLGGSREDKPAGSLRDQLKGLFGR